MSNPLDLRWQMVRDRWPVRVKNSSGETIPPYAVMRVTDWSKSNNEILYTVAKPDSTYRWQYLVNSPIAIGSGSSNEGVATFLGSPNLVYYNSGTPAYGESWGPTASQWYLTQHRPGFIVQGAHTETFNSKNLLCALQVVPDEIFVKNASGGDYAASHGGDTYQVWGDGVAGSEADTGLTVTAYNKMSISFKNGKFGSVGRLNGQNYAVTWQT
jgi:hypothetical protein